MGNFLNDSFSKKLLMLNEKISYVSLICIIIFLFMLSINFKLNYLIIFKNFLFYRKNKKEIDKNVNQIVENDLTESKPDIQENFTFDNFSKKKKKKEILSNYLL